MPQKINALTVTFAVALLGTAAAAPALPSAQLAQTAVRDALTPAPVAAPPAPQRTAPAAATPAQTAAANRAAQVARAQAQAARQAQQAAERARAQAQAAQRAAQQAAQARAQSVQRAQAAAQAPTRTGRSVVARATAYNSTPGQTDSTPFITATGTRVRSGVVALSRDLLRSFPYGSRIMIEDLSGRYNNLLRGRVFSVEDTMASYKRGSVDIWMTTRTQAIQFGARQVRITAVR